MREVFQAFDLSGRAAVVTGAGSGIGQATAQTLAAAGAAVVVGDVDEAGAEATVKAIAGAGGRAVAQPCDVASKAQVDALVDRALAEYGRLDVMCNVAGIPADGPLADCTEEQLDRALAVNLKGVFFGCQAAVRAMASRRSGSIINVSSAAIDAPRANYGVYALTKAAVAMLTKTLAVEAGPQGVRVNAIAPGVTITRFTARHLFREDGTLDQERYDAFVQSMRALSPLGMVGEPQDQAYLVLYLASDASRYVTGQIFRANGGQTFSW